MAEEASERLRCPACQSDHVQKLSVIFEGGFAVTEGRSHGLGMAFGPTLATGMPILMGSKSKGVQQTQASVRAAPPQRHNIVTDFLQTSVGVAVIALAIDVIRACNASSAESAHVPSLLGWILFLALEALAAAQGWSNLKYNLHVWPAEYSEWERKWGCLQCGEHFTLATQAGDPEPRGPEGQIA